MEAKMIIIGEKLNGFIPSTLQAIETKDEEFIKNLAIRQTECGADYLDICAGVEPQAERDTVKWLMDLAQGVVETPLCIDSSDVEVIVDMLPYANKPGLINSISGEPGKCERILPVIADTEWNVVALTCDQDGIPTTAEKKYEIAVSIINAVKSYGIALDRLFLDPLVTTLATTGNALTSFTDAVRMIKADYPEVHITSGLSNISFGMPFRKAINMQFLSLSMAAGMDSAIMDPTSDDMRATMYATAALIEKDENCRAYLKAYRKGLIGPKKK
jgi:5-methyltetrahydrofolate--homocysteine methyltransferase